MISNFDDLAFNKYTYPKFTSHNRIKLKETLLTVKEIVEAVLAALDIFIGWPVAILIVVLLFRKQIEFLFGMLGGRLRRISVFGAMMEFEDPELIELVRLMASSIRVDTLEDAMEEEASPDEEVSHSETAESLEQQRQRLRK